MVLSRRHRLILVIPLILLLLLTACERPLASNESEMAEESAEATAVAETAEAEIAGEADAEVESPDAETDSADENESADEAETVDEVDASVDTGPSEGAAEGEEAESEGDVAEEADLSDPDVGGGTPEMAEEEAVDSSDDVDEAAAEDMDTNEATEDADASEDSATEAGTDEAEQADDAEATGSESTEDDAEVAADSEDTTAEDMEVEESAETTVEAEADSSSTLPATHTVQPGENLYRIGLQYGMSWVTLAAYNNLPNANYVRVGQVLQIPGGDTPNPVPPPTTPDEPGYTDYVVQRGDTLNSIGRKFGVSWVEIAEANGIVNPNLIYAGQVLKIPTSQPETSPSVTHTVKSGETLNRISLQYGVHWLAIAQANNIMPPYVIYPGQVLVIPGG